MTHMAKTHNKLFPDEVLDKIDVPTIPRDDTTNRILGARPYPRVVTYNK